MEQNDYFEWLCERIDICKHPDYTLLVSKLHRTPYSLITGLEADAFRVRKAQELRNLECDHPDNRPVSCLEVMISIATEAEEKIMRDSSFGDRTSTWFWIMIDNLGLSRFTDEHFDTYEVEEILNKFVNRKYHKNGRGSIAFTKKSKKNFRKLDIWQQFNIYLSENYICA